MNIQQQYADVARHMAVVILSIAIAMLCAAALPPIARGELVEPHIVTPNDVTPHVVTPPLAPEAPPAAEPAPAPTPPAPPQSDTATPEPTPGGTPSSSSATKDSGPFGYTVCSVEHPCPRPGEPPGGGSGVIPNSSPGYVEKLMGQLLCPYYGAAINGVVEWINRIETPDYMPTDLWEALADLMDIQGRSCFTTRNP